MQRLTKEQAAIIGAYTGCASGPLSDVRAYIEKVMGRPVFPHETADRWILEQIQEAARADFLAICSE